MLGVFDRQFCSCFSSQQIKSHKMNHEYDKNQTQSSQPGTSPWLEHWPSKLACILASISTVCGIFTVLSPDTVYRWSGFSLSLFSLYIFCVEITLFVPFCASIQSCLVGLAGKYMARQAFWVRAIFYLLLTVLPCAIYAPAYGFTFEPPYGITLIVGEAANLAICVALLAAQLLGVPLNNEQMLSNAIEC